ncbi:MAG: DUF3090 family protein [Dehalococcoidia bacterium]|nr:DUF3090 family protein [Dehalococcoidia bacterium]
MPPREVDFGHAHGIKADAVGAPGQRRFRVLIEAEGGKACAWLEKPQLMQLALGIQELLSTQSPPQSPGVRRRSAGTPGGGHNLEFQVGTLTLGYERDADLVVLEFGGEDAEQDGGAGFRVLLDRRRSNAFAEQALAVCAAGRPLCPLCQGPVGPGPHVCPRTNGHVVV